MKKITDFVLKEDPEKIETVGQAMAICIELINKKTFDRVKDAKRVNKSRHRLLITEKGLRYYVLYKREYFMSFGKIFSLKGIGESINMEYMEFIMYLKTDAILFVHPDGRIYIIPAQEFIDWSDAHETIRRTKAGEITRSVPVNILRRWR